MMADILECEGYIPEMARNGQEALNLLQGSHSYLVFLDLMMPAFSGKEVCERLAAHPRTRRSHVIVLMSAMDRIEETGDLDIDVLMPKPFLVNDVAEILDIYMR